MGGGKKTGPLPANPTQSAGPLVPAATAVAPTPPPIPDPMLDAKKEAVKTYIEQTKLLVTLASAFVVAPAALVTAFTSRTALSLSYWQLWGFIFSEIFFVFSVLAGYVVLGTISGYQNEGKFDVDRTATRRSSFFQIGLYLVGMFSFIWFAYSVIANPPPPPATTTTSNPPVPAAVSAIPPVVAPASTSPANTVATPSVQPTTQKTTP